MYIFCQSMVNHTHFVDSKTVFNIFMIISKQNTIICTTTFQLAIQIIHFAHS